MLPLRSANASQTLLLHFHLRHSEVDLFSRFRYWCSFNLWVMKSVPIRGSVGLVIADSGLNMETDPTLPRIGTDFMTHKFETAPVRSFHTSLTPQVACEVIKGFWLHTCRIVNS